MARTRRKNTSGSVEKLILGNSLRGSQRHGCLPHYRFKIRRQLSRKWIIAEDCIRGGQNEILAGQYNQGGPQQFNYEIPVIVIKPLRKLVIRRKHDGQPIQP